MCMLQSGKGDIREKDAAMTMLNNTSSYSVAPVAFRRSDGYRPLSLSDRRRVGGSGQSPIPGAAVKKTDAVEITRVATGKLRSRRYGYDPTLALRLRWLSGANCHRTANGLGASAPAPPAWR